MWAVTVLGFKYLIFEANNLNIYNNLIKNILWKNYQNGIKKYRNFRSFKNEDKFLKNMDFQDQNFSKTHFNKFSELRNNFLQNTRILNFVISKRDSVKFSEIKNN